METFNGVENNMTVDASGKFSDSEWSKFCTPGSNDKYDVVKVDGKKILKTQYERARQTKRKASA